MVVSDSPKSLERRIKKQIHGQKHTAIVRFPKGLGEICFKEVSAALAMPLFREGGTAQLTEAAVVLNDIGFRELAALALRLTTAREIVWIIAEKKVTSKTEVRDLLDKIDWDLYLPGGASLALRVTSTASRLYHETMIKELAAKTLTARGYDIVTTGNGQYALDLRLMHDRMTVSLGLSATPIHRRGYKTILKGLASVKEDLGAGAVRFALVGGAPDEAPFAPDLVFVPFAGSGTLAFEAVLAIGSIPPGCFMPPISIEVMACMPEATRTFTRRKLATASPEAPKLPPCSVVEIDADQVEALQANLDGFNERLGEAGRPKVDFHLVEGDALDKRTWPTSAERVLVLLNPPYGDRIDATTKKGERLYATIGKRLEELAKRADVLGCVFAPTAAAAADIEGTTPSLSWSRLPVSHGGRPILLLRCRRR